MIETERLTLAPVSKEDLPFLISLSGRGVGRRLPSMRRPNGLIGYIILQRNSGGHTMLGMTVRP